MYLQVAPFMLLKRQANGSYEMNGLEGSMLEFMAQRLNFTPELILTDDKRANNHLKDPITGLPSNRPEISLNMVRR